LVLSQGRRVDYFFHFSLLFAALIYGLYAGSSLQVLWVGYTDFILPIRATFLIALICVPGGTLVDLCSVLWEKRRTALGRASFAAVGLVVEIVITCSFFQPILQFLTSAQVVNVSKFSIDIDAFATAGLMLTIFFFFYLWWYLKDETSLTNFGWYAVLPSMVFSLIFTPLMMVLAPARAIFGHAILLSPVVFLAISLAGVYIGLSRQKDELGTKHL
jgi:hypothetical protein